MMASTQPQGLAAFDTLRAEDEPWLLECYVPPAEFSLMAGPRSTLIFGETGAGKSALRRALTRVWGETNAESGWLLAQWPINALLGGTQNLTGSMLASQQQAQVFDVVARILLQRLGQQPELWGIAPDWTRATLAWFVIRFLQGDLETYVASLVDQQSMAGPEILRAIAGFEQTEILAPTAPPVAVIAELARALSRLGFHGIRIIVEDIEPWWEMYANELSGSLFAFLSTLALFEHPAFVYTMLLPIEMAPQLVRASSVVRRRVQAFTLRLSEIERVALVERRLAVALDKPGFELSSLGPADVLKTWLTGCGGDSPRGWLETIRPFVAAYLGTGKEPDLRRALSLEECRDVQQNHPPLFALDPSTGQITIGWRRVGGLSVGHLAMLSYLYNHMGQVCSRKQLYRVYVEASPGSRIESDARPAEYAGILDSAIWRLRAIMEPDPQAPVLIETRKGQGVLLRTL
jgi:hypothetical protein